MRKQIALLVAVAGFATISARGQSSFDGYPTGVVYVENFDPSPWNQTLETQFTPLNLIGSPAIVDTVTTVPEPSALALCAIGFAGLTIARRSFRQRRS